MDVAVVAKDVEVEEHVVKRGRSLLRPVPECIAMAQLKLLPRLVGESVRDFEAVQVAFHCNKTLSTH